MKYDFLVENYMEDIKSIPDLKVNPSLINKCEVVIMNYWTLNTQMEHIKERVEKLENIKK